jgi:hypothetical protein
MQLSFFFLRLDEFGGRQPVEAIRDGALEPDLVVIEGQRRLAIEVRNPGVTAGNRTQVVLILVFRIGSTKSSPRPFESLRFAAVLTPATLSSEGIKPCSTSAPMRHIEGLEERRVWVSS